MQEMMVWIDPHMTEHVQMMEHEATITNNLEFPIEVLLHQDTQEVTIEIDRW